MGYRSSKNRLRVRIDRNKHREQVFKSIITHPMETGFRRSPKTRKVIPADYIAQLAIAVDGETYIEYTWTENISRNPFFSFTLSHTLVDGQTMQVVFRDNHGRVTAYKFKIHFNQKGYASFDGRKHRTNVMQLAPDSGPVCQKQLYGNK